jgi:hypothetical protein
VILKNLTPHPLHIKADDGETIVLNPERFTTRVQCENLLIDKLYVCNKLVNLRRMTYGLITNLPDPQEGVIYIVSSMVKDHPLCKDREDIVKVGTRVRGTSGETIACYGLSL